MRRHPHLLEISAWPWLTRLSLEQHRHVTLEDVPAAQWDMVAARGFDIVFLMGVWRRSAIGRLMARTDVGMLAEYDRALPGWTMQDVPGSPYSIQAYEPDARMGRWPGLDTALTGARYRWTRDALEERGLYARLEPGRAHLFFVSPGAS